MRTLLTTLHSKYIHPSLALPYLSAYCGQRCGELLIREFTVHEPKENVLSRILACRPDVVAFSVYLWNRSQILELAAALATVRPEIRLVLGGPEVSFEGPDFFRRHPVAALICGEGEMPLQRLLAAWQRGEPATAGQGVRFAETDEADVSTCLLDDLDRIPSPFAAGLVDLSRGFVYYETSRGCPYDCSFCMSALDSRVRSFSMARIKSDLGLLMARRVGQIKLVDRTFNYHGPRSREIFRYILEHNRSSRFHFEIGAHLLDEQTLELLDSVPKGMFQFEIGVQSTLPETLRKVGRPVSIERLTENVARLRRSDRIDLHLDLIAGLPGETYRQFLQSLERTVKLNPHQLQIEPVKILPGAPLREQAGRLRLRFDPNPPYGILETPDLGYEQLESLRGIGRLVDLLWNSGKFPHLLAALADAAGSLAAALQKLEGYWRRQGLFDQPQSLRGLFAALHGYLLEAFPDRQRSVPREALARDFARSERVVPNSAPDFFDTELSIDERRSVALRVRDEVAAIRARGGKLQHFAAVFHQLPDLPGRTVLLFLYLSGSGERMRVREVRVA